MFRNFFDQRVNFTVSSIFLFLFGVVITSVVLDNLGLPNPLQEFGGVVALAVLFTIYGKAAFGPIISV